MALNGDNGGVDGRGGVAACEGAFRLQSAHPSLVSRMSFDIPASRRWRGLAVPSRRSLYGPHGDSVRLGGVGMGG